MENYIFATQICRELVLYPPGYTVSKLWTSLVLYGSAYILVTSCLMLLGCCSYLYLATKTTPTGNHNQFVTLGRKLSFFNNYKPQTSMDLYVTSGTTIDTYYAHYGIAGICIEVCHCYVFFL